MLSFLIITENRNKRSIEIRGVNFCNYYGTGRYEISIQRIGRAYAVIGYTHHPTRL